MKGFKKMLKNIIIIILISLVFESGLYIYKSVNNNPSYINASIVKSCTVDMQKDNVICD